MHRIQNTKAARSLLIDLIVYPENAICLKPLEWDFLLRMARSSRLLGRLGKQLESQGFYSSLPEKVNDYLAGAQALVERQQRMAHWEINRLQRSLSEFDIDIIVLKGCGYLISEIPVSVGRSFSDVDIMVSKRYIEDVENHLIEKGWRSDKLDEYDQRYYRDWMHEVPPLRHRDRSMEVDLHHTILPLTCKLKPNANFLFQQAIDVRGCQFKVLAADDMVLHSATHLFYGSELNGDLRDLVDLNDLFNYFSTTNESFWLALNNRAVELELQRPLFYALRYCRKLLGTSIPDFVFENIKTGTPAGWIIWIMDLLVPAAILPEHPDFPSRLTAIARWLLYVRSHYLRMPLYLLIPHFFRKSIKRQKLIPAMVKFNKDTTAN